MNPTAGDSIQHPSFAAVVLRSLKRKGQKMLDDSVPLVTGRWVLLVFTLLLYIVRVYFAQGFYIVTYGLGIFLLNLFIGFLTPIDDSDGDGPLLPTNDVDEFKPFVRKLPEFKFWYACIKAVLVAFCMTFFSIFNVPVFWPILLIYFMILFGVTMKRRIKHMIKYRYIPCSFGKKKYKGKSRKVQEDIRAK